MQHQSFDPISYTGVLPYPPFYQSNLSKSHKLQSLSNKPILKIPLQFTFLPVQILSKQLTKLNSPYSQRIVYLGPRWDNSEIWHKKYCHKRQSYEQFNKNDGYYFNQKRVNRNSSFLQDSMSHNRFYKSQIYYRAFQGMNPTLNLSEEVLFQSRFEGGNLDCAVRVAQNQYDLFLRIDSNTRGNIFWYYFSVQIQELSDHNNQNLVRQNLKDTISGTRRIKLNISNITKQKMLYQKFMRPYIYKKSKHQPKQSKQKISNWTQQSAIYNFTYQKKNLRYDFIYKKIRPSNFYQLSFEFDLKSDEIMYFAYCIPYSYSELMNDLSFISQEYTRLKQQKQISHQIIIRKLCQSSTGIDIPMLILGQNITKEEQNKTNNLRPGINNKKVIFITGRVHPGESNSSIILARIMKQLCLNKTSLYKYLRQRLIFVIIPMLNPDGVIIGNGRSSAIGKDLNRQFKSQNIITNPQVNAIKQLIDNIMQTNQIQLYLDFHGHSKMKNAFSYGPNYKINQFEYYKARIFPKIFSNQTSIFRYYSCNYSIPSSKKTTARAVMLNQFGLSFFYTIETSVGYFYDYNNRKNVMFNQLHYNQLASKTLLSIKQYYQGIQQYIQFANSRHKYRQRQSSPQKVNEFIQNQTIQQNYNKNKKPLKPLKAFKITKILQQIKLQSKKQQINSQASSDSYNEKELMQLEKSKELDILLDKCFKFQQRKYNFTNIEHTNNYDKIKQNNEIKHKKNRNRKLSKTKDQMLMQEAFGYFQNFQIKPTRTLYSRNLRNIKKQEEKIIQKQNFYSSQNQVKFNTKNNVIKSFQPLNFAPHSFFLNKQQLQAEKYPQNSAIKMFNFSQMVQNPRSLRYSSVVQSPRSKFRRQKIKDFSATINVGRKQQNKQKANIFKFQMISRAKQQIQSNSSKRFPSSFYRIKYQTSHKKYRKQRGDFDKDSSILQQNTLEIKNTPKTFAEQRIRSNSKNDGNTNFFIRVNRLKDF